MKKRIISGLWILAAAGMLCFALYRQLPAAEIKAHSIIFDGDYTNPYVIFIDRATGNICNKTTGVPAGGNTWAGNYIAAARHSQSNFLEIHAPPLDDNREYIMVIADSAAPAKTDTRCYTGIYSPTTRWFCDPEIPAAKGRVLIRN